MSHKSRLAQLEKKLKPIEQTNPYMTMPAHELIKRAWDAIGRGETLPVQPSTPQGDADRAYIAQKLQKLAEVQNGNQNQN